MCRALTHLFCVVLCCTVLCRVCVCGNALAFAFIFFFVIVRFALHFFVYFGLFSFAFVCLIGGLIVFFVLSVYFCCCFICFF